MRVLDVDAFGRRWSFSFYIIIGALTSICRYMIMIQRSTYFEPNLNKEVVAEFKNPWFLNIVMSLSMLVAFPVDWAYKKRNGTISTSKVPSIVWILIPVAAFFDILQCWIMNMSISSTAASFGTIMITLDVLFVALIKTFYQKKPLPGFAWFSIFLVFVSVAMSTYADYKDSTVNFNFDKRGIVLLCLELVGEIVRSIQYVIQEYIVQDTDITPELFLGILGIYDLMITLFMGIPITYFFDLPEWFPHFHENTCHSFEMFANSFPIILSVVVYFFVSSVMNMACVRVLYYTGSLNLAIDNGFCAAITWIIGVLADISENTKHYAIYILIGENWTKYSYLKCFAYIIMLFGLLIYSKIIRFPCFNYPAENRFIIPLDEIENC